MAQIIRNDNIDKIILYKFDDDKRADIFNDLLYFWGTDTGDLLLGDFWKDIHKGWNYFCTVLGEDEIDSYIEEVE